MWLLDANMAVHLAPILRGFSIQCATAANRGWRALSNGDLVSAAIEAGFSCILTQDRQFANSAARVLQALPDFAVVIVELPQQRWELYREDFLAHWAEKRIQPIPGKVTCWPGSN